jgi:hypothetical protein
MSTPKRVVGKKLLVASVGVAAISYMACTTSETSGNLVSPIDDASVAPLDAADAKDDALISSGNLVAPPPDDAGADAAKDAADEDVFIGSGNLVPPPDSGGD